MDYIEKENKYCNAAKQRLNKTIPIEDNYLDTLQNNRSKPRIPFGSLVELGIVKPGMDIFDQKRKINAKIMADGSIKYQKSEGSIHKIAAKILGTESCNGWTYWHYNMNGSIVPIDNLRQKLISTNQFYKLCLNIGLKKIYFQKKISKKYFLLKLEKDLKDEI